MINTCHFVDSLMTNTRRDKQYTKRLTRQAYTRETKRKMLTSRYIKIYEPCESKFIILPTLKALDWEIAQIQTDIEDQRKRLVSLACSFCVPLCQHRIC